MIPAARANPMTTGATGLYSVLSMVVWINTITRKRVTNSSTRIPWLGVKSIPSVVIP